jgi:hypothetical protein
VLTITEHIQRRAIMPSGKGTYGSKKGRPKKKKTVKKKKK